MEADAELNKIYRRLLEALRTDEQVAVRAARKDIQESQRLWLAHRDRTCMVWGNLVSYEVPACQLQLTKDRAAVLRHLHECVTQGGDAC